MSAEHVFRSPFCGLHVHPKRALSCAKEKGTQYATPCDFAVCKMEKKLGEGGSKIRPHLGFGKVFAAPPCLDCFFSGPSVGKGMQKNWEREVQNQAAT